VAVDAAGAEPGLRDPETGCIARHDDHRRALTVIEICSTFSGSSPPDRDSAPERSGRGWRYPIRRSSWCRPAPDAAQPRECLQSLWPGSCSNLDRPRRLAVLSGRRLERRSASGRSCSFGVEDGAGGTEKTSNTSHMPIST
jgi:hypothetical protein